MMDIPAVRFEQLAKRHGRQAVLRGVDLDIGAGQCFGLTGVNGAGKTSLIKCMLDFCGVDAGRIAIFGIDHRLPAARAALAFLPERFMPPYYLSGGEFLRYVTRLRGDAYDTQAATRMVSALDLEPAALARTARGYSKGMLQKLGLAACLLARRRLYVLDEPMSGLDPKARALLKEQLRRVREAGASVLLTTHALADVDEICDTMAILHDGRIAFAGTPQECRAQHGAASLEQAFLRCIR